jgi:3-methyladenine DNA glycosylase/8-oxoguanine DNA glycosylase
VTEVRVEVTPPWPFRLPRHRGFDGLLQIKRGVVHRLIHLPADGRPGPRGLGPIPDEQLIPVHIRIAQLSSGDVVIGARSESELASRDAIARTRRALGVDLDLRRFHSLFKNDPWIGRAVRANPAVRPAGRPIAFESLAWAVTEQLIEYERAAAIQRRMVAALGRHDRRSELRDSPTAARLAATAPARFEAMDLAGKRALAMIKVAREVACGRVNLESPDPDEQERGWARLRRIPEIGPWTTEILAVTGQGRLDQIPAGDLGFIKLVGRLHADGDPHAYATEQQVRDEFERFGEWKALAGIYALRSGNMSKNPLNG